MKYLAALTASCALMLVACERPVEPTAPRSSLVRARTAPASLALGEHIAYRRCYTDWTYDSGWVCTLFVANGDGTETGYYLGANDPSWSPDASKIVVESYGVLVVVTLADSSFTVLSAGQGPAWSPDGARIAFVSRDARRVYVMNADGSNVTLVADIGGYVGNPDWFPGGDRLAFECEVETNNIDICAINGDGSGFTRLTSGPEYDGSPAVSPDGTRIAFATGRYGQYASDIAVMNADGSNVTRLTTRGDADQPDWSPGGSRMSFTAFFHGACNDYCEDSFYTMNADGSHPLLFTSGSQAAWRPGEETPAPPDDPPVAHILSQCDDRRFCSFDSYASTDDHQIVSAVWNLGDGSGDIQQLDIYRQYAADGTYHVTLTVFDGSGQSSTDTTTVTVAFTSTDQPPVAGFTFSCTDLTCAFQDASTDDHYVSTHFWNFGDGSTTWTYLPNHTYAAGGTYQVTLTVTDNLGQTNSIAKSLTVTPPDLPPVAVFTSSCVGRTCTFASDASSDDHGITSRGWSFGDGTSLANVVAPSHSYAANGTYQVTLTVNDSKGQWNSVTHTVTAVDQPPVASFTYSCSNTTCTFDGRASSDDVGITSYAWKLGSQGTASGALVTFKFNGKASQQVTLTVKDGVGQSSSVTQTVVLK